MNGTTPPQQGSGMDVVTVIAQARVPARRMLFAAAKTIYDLVPNNVAFAAIKRGKHRADDVRVSCLWPCWVLETHPTSGEIIRETHVKDLHTRPELERFLLEKVKGGVLKKTNRFQVAQQGQHLRATLDIYGVIRVRNRAGELLAMSEPGQPDTLSAAFQPLTAADLAPRYS